MIKERIYNTLEHGLQVDLSLEASRRFLYRHIDKKVEIVILIVDIEGYTRLSMNIPTKTLANIVQLFAQEMSIVINTHNGYVFKYVGDSVIAFFPAEFDNKKACINALASAKDMINSIEHINEELKKRGYPRISIKISINYGSDLVVLYGKKNAHIDLVGSTISIASKILIRAHQNIVITQYVYNELDNDTRALFSKIDELIEGIMIYTLTSDKPINDSIDGKALVYKIIDELSLEEIASKNYSLVIKKILENLKISRLDDDTLRKALLATMHFMLSKTMIQSERSIKVDNYNLDIIIPSLRELKNNPKHTILLMLDTNVDLEKLSCFQPYKENIWIIGKDKEYMQYRVYVPDEFANNTLRPLSSIIDDIKSFKTRFDILPL
ncbi:MAG: adenylate/guanylate cyclase domain-containing protein [Candidatus Nitrosocaldaceae archaeon]